MKNMLEYGCGDSMAKKLSNTKKNNTKKELSAADIEKEEIIQNINKELTAKVKEKITKEVIDDIKNDISTLVKEDVKEDLKKDIEKEIKDDNKRIIRKKRGKVLRRDIIIIVLTGIIVFLIYYMYKQGNFSITINDNSNNKNNNIDKTYQNQIIPTNNEEDYTYLLKNIKVNLPVDNINAFYLYTDIYDEVSIDSAIKLNIIYKNINKNEFSDSEAKEAYKKMFGTIDNYKATDFDYDCKHFKYDSKNSIYKLVNDSCIKLSNKEIKEEIIKVTKEDDFIYLETIMGVLDKKNNSLYNFQNLYTPIATNLVKDFTLEDYSKYLSKFKYTFKYVDGMYRFTKIVKLN